VLLTLQYAGADPVFLDGGLGAWTRGGNATTADVTPAKQGKLSPLKIRPVVVDAAYIQANVGKPGIAIVDGRAGSFYDGVQEGGPPDARKKGHIQGAVSVPFTEITTTSLNLKSADELRALFAKAGVKPGDRIVGYCHIGQQATAMLFAARTLGHDVVLYDGSFEDWSRRGLPVAVPPGK
jgi:thiosulfate/3-mercaptopyruvate sulfurtransferase